MVEVVGIKLDSSNNVYFFSPGDIMLEKGDLVIVNTENGLQIGKVCKEKYSEKKENLFFPLSSVLRLATVEDKEQAKKIEKESEEALEYAKKTAKSMGLEMYFAEAKFTFERTQLYLSYTADSRIDFREIAKKLAQKYKTRIELRQIGVRDKAKKVGGLGPCGLFLCCNTFLTDFNAVSINMTKNQMLALSPTKINGICGRLLCCLNYEDDTYTDLKKNLPQVGSFVKTNDGEGKVISINIFNNTYQVSIENKGIFTYENEKK